MIYNFKKECLWKLHDIVEELVKNVYFCVTFTKKTNFINILRDLSATWGQKTYFQYNDTCIKRNIFMDHLLKDDLSTILKKYFVKGNCHKLTKDKKRKSLQIFDGCHKPRVSESELKYYMQHINIIYNFY